MGLLLFYVAIALGISFLCSLLEAALLSSRMASLMEKKKHGSRGAGMLLEMKQHRVDDAISAILTLNTVSNTLGATLAGAQAARVFGNAWVGVFSGTLTLLILVFSEIIPKTLGAVYARSLSGLVGWTLHLMMTVMRPALVLSGALTRLLTRGSTPTFSRGELAAMIATAQRDGAISAEESQMFANLLRFDQARVADVMTPRTVAFMLPAEATVDQLLEEADAQVFSRIPLYHGQPDNVVGYVLQRDVLRAFAKNRDGGRTLDSYRRPIGFIPELATVGAALRQILEQREPIAVVTDEHGGVEGLVTLEDLTETILGVEIVDESDRVADMREVAVRLRKARIERMREARASLSPAQPQTGPADGDPGSPPSAAELKDSG